MYSKIKRRNKFLNGIPRTVQRPWLLLFCINWRSEYVSIKSLKMEGPARGSELRLPKGWTRFKNKQTNKPMTPELHRNTYVWSVPLKHCSAWSRSSSTSDVVQELWAEHEAHWIVSEMEQTWSLSSQTTLVAVNGGHTWNPTWEAEVGGLLQVQGHSRLSPKNTLLWWIFKAKNMGWQYGSGKGTFCQDW